MTIILHGIPNCDTVKKARAWLDAAGVDYAFHDYKKAGVEPTGVDPAPLASALDRRLQNGLQPWRPAERFEQQVEEIDPERQPSRRVIDAAIAARGP